MHIVQGRFNNDLAAPPVKAAISSPSIATDKYWFTEFQGPLPRVPKTAATKDNESRTKG